MKKQPTLRTLLSLVLALAMCLSLAIPGFAASSSSPFAGGSGTKDDPYQISSVAGLFGMNKDLGACYELVSDIDFDGLKAWMPVGYYSVDPKAMISGDETVPAKYTFHGTFNGNGHTIRNLTCASANLLASGVFGFTGGNAYLHDVNLENFSTQSILCSGSLVGWASGNTKVENVKVNNVKARSVTMAGGLFGSSNGDVTVKNVTVTNGSAMTGVSLYDGLVEIMEGDGCAGGIIGGADGTSFENCNVNNFKVVNAISKTDAFGGLCGCANEAKYIKNCSVENVVIKSVAGATASIGGLSGFIGSEAGITDPSKRTVVSGCSVNNVKMILSDQAERVGGLIGSGTYRGGQDQPFAYVVENCSVSNVAIETGGKYIGTVVGYLPASSAIADNTVTNVTLNGKALSEEIGTTEQKTPYTELVTFGMGL